jgi:quinoprotein glucose dehydrogenase
VKRRFVIAALLSSAVAAPVLAPRSFGAASSAPKNTNWQFYAGTLGGTKYAPLDQINAGNVKDLKVVWRVPAAPPEALLNGRKAPVGNNYEHTPLFVDGLLYARSETGPLIAMDPLTGKVVWVDKDAKEAGRSRGISYWTDGKDARIFALDGSHLIAVNAKTGKRYPDFGDAGSVDLAVYGDPRPNSPVKSFSWSSFPLVVGDTVVIAGVPEVDRDKIPANMKPGLDAPGDIRGYDARTGKLIWTFHVIPRPGEFGYDTWKNNSADVNGLGGTWTWLTGDEKLGKVYIATEAPSNDFFGGHRPGDNLFADTILCLDAKTGKRAWHFQTIHHDIWDFDNPAPPVLMDIKVDGKKIQALAQISKQDYVYVLDRTNGKPVWPIVEKPVPAGSIPGEYYSPTQPVPSKPEPIDLQQLTENDLIDFTPELHQQAVEIFKKYLAGGVYSPQRTDQEIIMLPGTTGGANWPGAAFDPETGMFYVPFVRNPVRSLDIPGNDSSVFDYERKAEADRNIELPFPGADFRKAVAPGDPTRLPFTKPPYGGIAAYDMNKGHLLWKAPNGDGPRNHPALKGLNLPQLGSHARPSPLVTKTLLFMGEGRDAPGGPSLVPPWAGGKKFQAFDKATGKVISAVDLGAGTSGAPITYMLDGKQYIVVTVGWHDRPSEIVALALP